VREAIDALVGRLNDILDVLVYGSVARGEADRQSDVDIWVLVREDGLVLPIPNLDTRLHINETQLLADALRLTMSPPVGRNNPHRHAECI